MERFDPNDATDGDQRDGHARLLVQSAAAHLEELRRRRPLVQCILGPVSAQMTANVLLAAGASPAMVHGRGEVADYVRRVDALSINISSLTHGRREAALLVARIAHEQEIPWVLDPVACGGSPYRFEAARALCELRPQILRGNASEILHLGGGRSSARGADALESVRYAQATADALARRLDCVVGVSGEVDYVSTSDERWHCPNGHPHMPLVTALGCGLSALAAAFLGVAASPLEAMLSAFVIYGVAGEEAGRRSAGPGSLAPAFLDALHALTPDNVYDAGRLACAAR
ncbi:MAG: hydroxyethylthiazole kinase [Neomegalonema sp.]|nr:hydroxyethylthiazole kinase [Neomegalonema sp.]